MKIYLLDEGATDKLGTPSLYYVQNSFIEKKNMSEKQIEDLANSIADVAKEIKLLREVITITSVTFMREREDVLEKHAWLRYGIERLGKIKC